MKWSLSSLVDSTAQLPLKWLSAGLLRIPFVWCPVGWTTWALRQTRGANAFFKLQAGAPRKVERNQTYWPTPMSASHQLVDGKQNGKHFMLSHAIGQVEPAMIGQAINPAWVEINMGFPEGWTDLRAECLGSPLQQIS